MSLVAGMAAIESALSNIQATNVAHYAAVQAGAGAQPASGTGRGASAMPTTSLAGFTVPAKGSGKGGGGGSGGGSGIPDSSPGGGGMGAKKILGILGGAAALKFLGDRAASVGMGMMPGAQEVVGRGINNWNLEMMNGFQGMGGANQVANAIRMNPNSVTSPSGVNTMLSGMASMGFTRGGMGSSSFNSLTASMMGLNDYGINNSDIPEFMRNHYGAATNNKLKMMLGPNGGTVDAMGKAKPVSRTMEDIWKFTTKGNAMGMGVGDIDQMLMPDRQMDINLRETGMEHARPMMEEMAGATKWLKANPDAAKSLAKSGWDLNNLTMDQAQTLTGRQDDVTNPAQIADQVARASAEDVANKEVASLKGVRNAADAQVKYLHFLEKLEPLQQTAALIAAMIATDENSGLTGVEKDLLTDAGHALFQNPDSQQRQDDALRAENKLYRDYDADPDNPLYWPGGDQADIGERARNRQTAAAANGEESPSLTLRRAMAWVNRGALTMDEFQSKYQGSPGAFRQYVIGEHGIEKWESTRDVYGNRIDVGKADGTGRAVGDWDVTADVSTRVHQGEMVIPSRIATQIRKDLKTGGRPTEGTPHDIVSSSRNEVRAAEEPSSSAGGPVNVTFNITVGRATDEEINHLAQKVQNVFDRDRRLSSISQGFI